MNLPISGCFKLRHDFLARTSEGRQFLRQAGNDMPHFGDRFHQPELAKSLRAVAKQGSQYMYTGLWGQDFVKTIQREGGKVTIEDLAHYRVDWSEPFATTFNAHKVYTAGLPSQSAYHILPALNLAEELKLNQQPPYWESPVAIRNLQRISDLIENAPQLDPRSATFLRTKGIDISPAAQLNKAYARAVAPLLEQLEAEIPDSCATALERSCGYRQRRQHRGDYTHHQLGDLGRHGHRGGRHSDPGLGRLSTGKVGRDQTRRPPPQRDGADDRIERRQAHTRHSRNRVVDDP